MGKLHDWVENMCSFIEIIDNLELYDFCTILSEELYDFEILMYTGLHVVIKKVKVGLLFASFFSVKFGST